MSRIWKAVSVVALVVLFAASAPVYAQEAAQEAPESAPVPVDELTLFTPYPDQMAELGETVNFDLTLRTPQNDSQVVELSMGEIPEGWTATFMGGSRVVKSVYVEPQRDASVSLQLQPPKEVEPGTYRFTVVATNDNQRTEMPLSLTIQDKLPSRLSFNVDLPTIRGGASSSFNYSAIVRNEGDEEATVNLSAEAPKGFAVNFSVSGQDVTSFPVGADETKNVSIELTPPPQVPAGKYEFVVKAQGGDLNEEIPLMAEVTGEASIELTTPDERLSGEATAGQAKPFKFIIRNTGSAPARAVTMSSSEPSGWSVQFEPKEIPEIAPNSQVEVTAHVQPSDKAVAGDYNVNIRANADEGGSQSSDFRITVRTSTMWGIVGVGLIAVAVGSVGLAVSRFGRR